MATVPRSPASDSVYARLQEVLSSDPEPGVYLKDAILAAAKCVVCQHHLLTGTLVAYPCGKHLIHKQCFDAMGDTVGNTKCEACAKVYTAKPLEFGSSGQHKEPFIELLRKVLKVPCCPQINDPINQPCDKYFAMYDKTGIQKHRDRECPYAKRCCIYCGVLLSPMEQLEHPCKVVLYDGALNKINDDDDDDDNNDDVKAAPSASASGAGAGIESAKRRKRKTAAERAAGVQPGAKGDDDESYSDSDENPTAKKKHKSAH